MNAAQQPDTEELLEREGSGDRPARQQLLARHRSRLRQMIALGIDRRMAARVDPSYVVQEALADAAQGLSDYLAEAGTTEPRTSAGPAATPSPDPDGAGRRGRQS